MVTVLVATLMKRKNTINVIAARPKTGKTLLSDNMGFYIANELNIPVLNMDTEMTKEDHIHRILAMSTEVEINKIAKDFVKDIIEAGGEKVKEEELFKKREFIICEVIYVNVAAPSSKDKPLINDISKSLIS